VPSSFSTPLQTFIFALSTIGQAGALRNGLAKAVNKLDEAKFRPILRPGIIFFRVFMHVRAKCLNHVFTGPC